MPNSDAEALPPDLLRSIAIIEETLYLGPSDEICQVLDRLAEVPAGAIVQAARQIGGYGGLGQWGWGGADTRRPSHFFKRTWTVHEVLSTAPAYAWLYLFHPNGRVREIALRQLPGAPMSPFFFSALVLRLNDWAPPVREAALQAARLWFPTTDATVVAIAGFELLDRLPSWRRWATERSVLDEALGRTDVATRLVRRIGSATTGPLGAKLRQTLRFPAVDALLPDLAARAVSPYVRATSLDCLLAGKAIWPDGYEWRWVDKIYGLKRLDPRLETRPLGIARDVEALIRQGLADRSAVVRRVAAKALVEARGWMPDTDLLVERMIQDRSASVRMTADYILRHPL